MRKPNRLGNHKDSGENPDSVALVILPLHCVCQNAGATAETLEEINRRPDQTLSRPCQPQSQRQAGRDSCSQHAKAKSGTAHKKDDRGHLIPRKVERPRSACTRVANRLVSIRRRLATHG